MTSWMKSLLILAIAVAVFGGWSSQALAVFGDGAGHGGQFTNKKGTPVAGVKVKITRTLPNGTTRTDETETDDRGFFYLPPGGGNTGGGVTQIQFIQKNGEVSTFGGPFSDVYRIPISERNGTNPSDVILDFDYWDSDEEGGNPWWPNIANVDDWFDGPDDDDMYPWRVQNPGGATFTTGVGAGFLRKDYNLNFLRTNTTFEDRNASGLPTGSSPAGSSNENEDALTNDFDPNIALNIAFGEIFMTMPSQRFSKYRIDNALNIKVGAADVNFEQNRTGGNNSEQTEFSGTVPYIGFGGSHVMYAPGFPIFMGLNWDLSWIPNSDLGREPIGTPSSSSPLLTRQNRLSYQSSSVEARIGWVLRSFFAPFFGVGGSWQSVDVRTRYRTDEGSGFVREQRVDQEYDGGGAYGLAGADFRVLRSPLFGRVQSTFNGDGYGMLFKLTMPLALPVS